MEFYMVEMIEAPRAWVTNRLFAVFTPGTMGVNVFRRSMSFQTMGPLSKVDLLIGMKVLNYLETIWKMFILLLSTEVSIILSKLSRS